MPLRLPIKKSPRDASRGFLSVIIHATATAVSPSCLTVTSTGIPERNLHNMFHHRSIGSAARP
ncbi:hypothetical protein KCP76_25095 [Salmonella enterica subsp. enterica serovar Weltevreden]|nr:hypothetical protein KCP76_25095 [Salmonella enterica subsp. enterica serovar Weltevreden]